MLCSNGFCVLMLSPHLSVCLPTHPCAFPRCLQLPHGVGVRLGEETWGPHFVVLLLQGPGFLSAPFTHLEGGANLPSPHPPGGAAPPSPSLERLSPCLPVPALTETLRPVASLPPVPVVSSCMRLPAWSREESETSPPPA